MIFYHLIQKILMIYYVTTTKLYGLEQILEIEQNMAPILSLSVLSKGNANHPIEDTNLVAFCTTDAVIIIRYDMILLKYVIFEIKIFIIIVFFYYTNLR